MWEDLFAVIYGLISIALYRKVCAASSAATINFTWLLFSKTNTFVIICNMHRLYHNSAFSANIVVLRRVPRVWAIEAMHIEFWNLATASNFT